MIDALISKAAQANAIAPGDYQKDGLWYCGKCNTPKQCVIEIDGVKRFPFCMCSCKKAEWHETEERQKREQQAARVNRLREAGFEDGDMKRFTFAVDDGQNERLTKTARRYVEHFADMLDSGKGLLLYGTVGTGKTFMAACIANALIDKGYPCLVTNFTRVTNIINGMRDERQKYLDSLNRYTLLVVDDLATERDTDYMIEVVQSVIDARYRARKPLIITTNLTADELKRPADIRKERLYSRLLEMCIPIQVSGKDRRKAQLRDDMKRYGELLEL